MLTAGLALGGGCRRGPRAEGRAQQVAPQQVIVNFTIRETEQGKLLWTLKAKEAQVFETQDIAELAVPRWEYFQRTSTGIAPSTRSTSSGSKVEGLGTSSSTGTFPKQGTGEQPPQTTRLQGERGKVHLTSHDIEVWDHVVVDSADGSRLETEALQYLAGPQRMVSYVAVKLTRPDSITTGVGLEATPDLKVVTIHKERVEVKR